LLPCIESSHIISNGRLLGRKIKLNWTYNIHTIINLCNPNKVWSFALAGAGDQERQPPDPIISKNLCLHDTVDEYCVPKLWHFFDHESVVGFN
jgi:hypothetical protein